MLTWSCGSCPQALQELRAAVEGQLGETAALLWLRGAVEHLREGGPLPAPQDAASLYTLEHLDLSQL